MRPCQIIDRVFIFLAFIFSEGNSMNFNKLGVAKFIISGVVGIGTGKIVGKIIKSHVMPETLIDKVTVTAAALVIGAIATERTKAYTNDMVDEVVENVEKVVDNLKESNTLAKVNRGEVSFEDSGLDPIKFIYNKDNKWVRAKSIDDEVGVS
jgi:hypothetical protein